MASKLNDEQIKNAQEFFKSLDTDNSGRLDAKELKEGLAAVGVCLNDFQVSDLICAMDLDGSKDIDFNEFCTFGLTAELFTKYDVNGDGFIGPDEIHGVLKELGYKNLTPEEIKKIVDSVDTNHDGKLDFDELRKLTN
jgi:Ca2+-binding EF-hand superfamily protein